MIRPKFFNKILKFILICLGLNFTSCHLNAMAPKRDWNQAIDHAVMRYGLRTEPELKRYFKAAKVSYPPKQLAFLAFKKEQIIELWAKDHQNKWSFIHKYPLTATSGQLGPKLKENDRQIPEGIYRLTMFNPYSAMHLSMQINYPNQFDRLHAFKDGRTRLGGDIFLHGKNLSVGCLAIGDHAIDQLFLLVRRVGLANTKVIIAPNDLRKNRPATNTLLQPKWVQELYHEIAMELHNFGRPIHQYS
jgi:L,D-transpeptidase catalytic domain